MRLYIIKTIYNCLNLLKEAHTQLKLMINKKEFTRSSVGLLIDCQKTAMEVGYTIEREMGENTVIVKKVENYCEELYQLKIAVENANIDSTVINKLDTIIESIVRDVKQIEVQIEIAFLPYKASMWDCMESIWLAAKEDKRCSCFVIPIPYYDKDSTKKFTKLHYEGNLFPHNIEIIYWEDYDFIKRKPDIIYIHNPYDNSNKLTSVHPYFYSKNLKKYTNMLVYIPYFVNTLNIQEHMCTLPGTLYADKVIVENEIEKTEYIKHIRIFEKEFNCEGYFGKIEEKFLPLGSPKYDRVINTKKEFLDIPKEWIPKIKERKVLLYNTSIQELMEYKELYLNKIEDTFYCLKERLDLVLLWRPHPLFRTTLESLIPTIVKRYDSIVDKYKQENWGIFDDTHDPERAIALADFYYGDNSSLAAMCQKVGKKTMIQNVKILQKKEPFFTGFSSMVFVKDELWATAYDFNGLIKINMYSRHMELVTKIPGEELYGKELYGDIIYACNKLILIPMSAKEIAIYDISLNQFHKIPIDESLAKENKIYKSSYKFCKGLLAHNEIILLSCSFPAIVKLNLSEFTIKYIQNWVEEFDKSIINKDEVYFRNYYFDGKNTIWMASCSCNKVLKYCYEDNYYHIYTVGEVTDCFSDIYFSNDQVFLSSKNGNEIIITDFMNKNDVTRLENTKGTISAFMTSYKDNLFVYPYQNGKLVEIDTKNKAVKNTLRLELMNDGFGVLCGVKKDEYCYYMIWGKMVLIKHSLINNTIEKIYLQPSRVLNDMIIENIQIPKITFEDENIYLYLMIIENRYNPFIMDNDLEIYENSGMKINSTINNLILNSIYIGK